MRADKLKRFSGEVNMSLDAGLLASAEADDKIGRRVYGWDGPWISLGMNQNAREDLRDPDLVPFVFRPTGGKAVLHGHDVTVGFAVPLVRIGRETPAGRNGHEFRGLGSEGSEDSGDLARYSRSVRAVYRWMTAPIIEAMKACGLPAGLAEDVLGIVRSRTAAEPPEATDPKLAETEPHLKSPDCFKLVSPNDIIDVRSLEKCCGCALRITKTAALIQASIPAGKPLVDPSTVFENPSCLAAPKWDSELFADRFEMAIQFACSE